jgi:ribonuclease P protein component
MEKNKHTISTKEQALSKKERISNKKDIEKLFAEGNAFLAFPLRVVYVLTGHVLTDCEPAKTGVSILVSVSKRHFKKAVDRNRIKRLIRESYRLNKSILTVSTELSGYSLQIAFLYIHKEQSTYQEVEKGVKKALNSIRKEKFSEKFSEKFP